MPRQCGAPKGCTSMDCLASLSMPQAAPLVPGLAAPAIGTEGAFATALAQACAAAPSASGDAATGPIDTLPVEDPTLPAMAVADAVAIPQPSGVAVAVPMPPVVPPPTSPDTEPRTVAGAPATTPAAPAAMPKVPHATSPAAHPKDATGEPPVAVPERTNATAMPTSDAQDAVVSLPLDGPPPPVTESITDASGAPARQPARRTQQPPSGESVPPTPPQLAPPTATAAPAAPSVVQPKPQTASHAEPLRAATPSRGPVPEPEKASPATASQLPAPVPPKSSAAPDEAMLHGIVPPRPSAEAFEAAKASEASITPPTGLHPVRSTEAPPPTASPPPPPPPTATPARQIAPVLVSVAIAGGTARLSVSLEPAELGRVEISVERHGDTAEVRVVAERPETLALLQRDQRELDRSLTQAGIAAEGRSLSFTLADGGGGFGGGRDGDGRQAMARGMRSNGVPGDAVPPAEASPRRPLSLLDLAV